MTKYNDSCRYLYDDDEITYRNPDPVFDKG